MSKILLAHGSGGKASHRLLHELIIKYLGNTQLNKLEDQAIFTPPKGRLAFTTDSYVIKPIKFPGGDIGRLAVCGTINDLAVGGAKPLFISLGLIIEEGLELDTLEEILISIRNTCRETGVEVVTGDTKVVDRGAADKIFINTSGIGIVPDGLDLGTSQLQEKDKLILSGGIGEHALAVMIQRENLGFTSELKSDVAPLYGLVETMLASGAKIKAMRDPTRGGLASVLNEWAEQSQLSITINEDKLPLCGAVRGGCDVLGLDPLYMANEGKLVVAVAPKNVDNLLNVMQKHILGKQSAIIGETSRNSTPQVVLNTGAGGQRLLNLPEGEILPRIC